MTISTKGSTVQPVETGIYILDTQLSSLPLSCFFLKLQTEGE